MKSIKHTIAFEISRSIEEVFPLFSPEGEKHWVPGWDYENVMGTNDLSEDYVFLTKTHNHRTSDAIWIVKKYDPESYFIQFYKIEPENKVGVVTVRCLKINPEGTKVQVTYEYIAISPAGDKFISEFSESDYKEFIGEWQMLLIKHFEDRG